MSEPPSTEPLGERPGTKLLDYIALGLILAPPAVVFEIYIKGEPISWPKTVIATLLSWVIGGLVVWASKVWQSWLPPTRWRIFPLILAAENKIWGKASVIALCIGGALALSSFLSNKSTSGPVMMTGFTQQQVDQQIASATNSLQVQLNAANNTIARLEARPASSAQPAPSNQSGPINWQLDGQLVVVTGGGPEATINSILLEGRSTAPVTIKEAYALSGLTGHKREFAANVQARHRLYPVDKVDIPSDAPVCLELVFKPAMSVLDFQDQWGQFQVIIVYSDGKTFVHEFDENFVREKLQRMGAGAFGPHVTPKE